MGRISGRWLGIGVAVLVVLMLALFTAGGSKSAPAIVTMQEDPSAPVQTVQTVPGMSPSALIGLVLKVGIVAALLGGSLWLLRRYAGSGSRSGGRTGAISIVDTIALAQNRALYVIDVGDKAAVIGATLQQFTLLTEITDPQVLARLRAAPERPESPISDLSQRFGSFLQSMNAAREAAIAGRSDTPASGEETRRHMGQPAPSFAETFSAYNGTHAGQEPHTAEPRRAARPLYEDHGGDEDTTERLNTRSMPSVDAELRPAADPNARLRALAERLRAAQDGSG